MTSGNKTLAGLAAGLTLLAAFSVRTHSTVDRSSGSVALVTGAPTGVRLANKAPTTPAQAPSIDEATKSKMRDALAKVPMSFEINRGQTAKQVQFLSRGAGYTLFLTRDAAVLALPVPSNQPQQTRQSAAI